MPGLRRFLDVASKISGALVDPRAQGDQTGRTPPDASGDRSILQEAEVVLTSQSEPVAPPEPGTPAEPDAACAAAVDLARTAAVEVGGDAVGDHLGATAEPSLPGEHVVTHSFVATQPDYRGWRWAVTVARVEGADGVTVDEVVLLPGEGALLAPPWVPWADRLRPDDLGPGDLLPPPADDPRLVPSYEDVTAPRLPAELDRDLGLGRPRVLSRQGRADAAERWFDGPAGPGSAMARHAPGRCATCGFLVLLVGDLGRGFGVCANDVAPDDGKVVALQHGCGAHSETVASSPHASTTSLAVEHDELELVDVAALPDPPGEAALDRDDA